LATVVALINDLTESCGECRFQSILPKWPSGPFS
jgi:hypothetical protein